MSVSKTADGSSNLSTRAQESRNMKKLVGFVQGSIDELTTYVSWPKWSELQSSSALVIFASLIFAVVIGLIDFTFKYVLSSIY
jgi:preprotein translocase subunit SecE